MKTIITTIALSISSLIGFSQDTAELIINEDATTEVTTEITGTTITVNVPVPKDEGTVFFSLQTEDNFLKGGIANIEAEIVDGKATATFENVKPGEYGVTLYWDKNGNKKMDFEPTGMPKEMYGVSNNGMSFGPPQWNEAKFIVDAEPQVLEIRM